MSDPSSDPSLDWLGDGETGTRTVAEIWATVDLERAADDVVRAVGEQGGSADDLERAADDVAGGRDRQDQTVDPGLANRDPLLGARVLLVSLDAGRTIALAEPTTEGRLAAVLARHGEGPVGRYVIAPGGLEAVRARAARAGIPLSRTELGPFGPAVLVLGASIGSPLLVIVDRPGGTIPAMIERQPVTLRAATADDAERIAALFTDEGYPAGPSDIVERLGRFGSELSRVIVADNGGEVLGFVAVHALPRFEHSDRIVRVMALVVDPGERGRGIGRLLMEEAERLGREVGAAFAEVTAGHHRPDAQRLYEELGYDGSVAAYLRKRL